MRCAFALGLLFLAGGTLQGTCYKCEIIREENKNLPPLEYEFYDEYLESLKKKQEAKDQPAAETEKEDS